MNEILGHLKSDEEGFFGRECPQCEGYFKIQFGTGLKGENLPCSCPYCGHKGSQDTFWTKDQLKHINSQVLRHIQNEFSKVFKKTTTRSRPNSGFGITIKYKAGRPQPIHYYREKKLQEEVICDKCTLRYAIYGTFGYCPDCGVHNSLQILKTNFTIIEKILMVAESSDQAIKDKLIENGLEDAVSAIDGYGRELSKLFAPKSSNPVKAQNISFQNIEGAQTNLVTLFSIDITQAISTIEWNDLKKLFQKRHLLAHKMGVIDQSYISATGESPGLIGRKVEISSQEVRDAVKYLVSIGQYFYDQLHLIP